jgi:hypothetical protein
LRRERATRRFLYRIENQYLYRLVGSHTRLVQIRHPRGGGRRERDSIFWTRSWAVRRYAWGSKILNYSWLGTVKSFPGQPEPEEELDDDFPQRVSGILGGTEASDSQSQLNLDTFH